MKYILIIFGPSLAVCIWYIIRIKLMKRRFRKEVEIEIRQWEAKMTEKYGIEFKT